MSEDTPPDLDEPNEFSTNTIQEPDIGTPAKFAIISIFTFIIFMMWL